MLRRMPSTTKEMSMEKARQEEIIIALGSSFQDFRPPC